MVIEVGRLVFFFKFLARMTIKIRHIALLFLHSGSNTMLLLTNCEVHTPKYSDYSFDVQKLRPNIFRMEKNFFYLP